MGDPYLNDLSSCSAKFLQSRAGVLRFFDRTTDQPLWGIDTPRMPAVATMVGSRGRSSWTCGTERARTTKIDVPCPPHSDHFERSFKGSRFYAREVTINDARSQESPINHEAIENEVKGASIDARKSGVFPPPPLEERWNIIMRQMGVKLEHQQTRGASTLH